MEVNDGETPEHSTETKQKYLSFEWKKITIVSFFCAFTLWKIITLTEVRITNVICVIVGDSGEKFSSISLYGS